MTTLAARPQIPGSKTFFDITADGEKIGSLTKTLQTHSNQRLDTNAPLDDQQTYGMLWYWNGIHRNRNISGHGTRFDDALLSIRKQIEEVEAIKLRMPGNVILTRPHKDPSSWTLTTAPDMDTIRKDLLKHNPDLIRLRVDHPYRAHPNHTILVDRLARRKGIALNDIASNLYSGFVTYGNVLILEELTSIEIKELPYDQQAA